MTDLQKLAAHMERLRSMPNGGAQMLLLSSGKLCGSTTVLHKFRALRQAQDWLRINGCSMLEAFPDHINGGLAYRYVARRKEYSDEELGFPSSGPACQGQEA